MLDPMEKQAMREAVATEYGFRLYGLYSEPEALAILRKTRALSALDLTTMKRWRDPRRYKVPPIRFNENGGRYSYLGIFIADFITGGNQCQSTANENTSLANTGSHSEPEAPRGIAHGLMPEAAKPNVQALAQTTFPKPKNG
jgi:hypothetical protein